MKKKYSKPILHILIWMVLFLTPIILMNKRGNLNANDLSHSLVPLIEASIIFYINYFLLVEKWIFTKHKYWPFIIINILIISFFRFDMMLIHILVDSGSHTVLFKTADVNKIGYNVENNSKIFSTFKSIIILVFPVFFAIVTKTTELWQSFEYKKKVLENLHLESELTNLKYQLQPHFFFNSLNNIYSLVDISPDIAQQSIHNLSKLMRYMLYETKNEKTDLINEISFLKKYVELMGIRYASDVNIITIFPNIETNQYQIAPLLLIPIFENAYKHGISPTENSKIIFDLSIVNNQLIFNSTNSNFQIKENDITASGIGIENLKKRLELIYKNRYKLNIIENNEIYNLKLIIDLDKIN